jgi:hypothetical protein
MDGSGPRVPLLQGGCVMDNHVGLLLVTVCALMMTVLIVLFAVIMMMGG